MVLKPEKKKTDKRVKKNKSAYFIPLIKQKKIEDGENDEEKEEDEDEEEEEEVEEEGARDLLVAFEEGSR
ncbi:hypothetical protein V1477_020017 [Vespula maculifrons]|uniref:Uncharacterized protein n=1 Tax=Vespula maculifrons TaxID=7453 RepID=A0ABD2AKR1_VESMC